jgi:hypothetical protein
MCWGGAVEVSQATDAWRTLEAYLGSLEEQLEAAQTALREIVDVCTRKHYQFVQGQRGPWVVHPAKDIGEIARTALGPPISGEAVALPTSAVPSGEDVSPPVSSSDDVLGATQQGQAALFAENQAKQKALAAALDVAIWLSALIGNPDGAADPQAAETWENEMRPKLFAALNDSNPAKEPHDG